ncbi:hypothetical protein ExPCM14_00001 [Escherichia coli]|nr:hypothetical protein ExPCM14_00001 [Escherichia coli]
MTKRAKIPGLSASRHNKSLQLACHFGVTDHCDEIVLIMVIRTKACGKVPGRLEGVYRDIDRAGRFHLRGQCIEVVTDILAGGHLHGIELTGGHIPDPL